MEPAAAEITAIKASAKPLNATLDWVGVQAEVLAAFQRQVGKFTLLREFMYISGAVCTAGINAGNIKLREAEAPPTPLLALGVPARSDHGSAGRRCEHWGPDCSAC